MKAFIINPLKAFIMSLGMFSIIPVPRNNWNDKYTHMVIPCLPVVGALIGIIWYAAAAALVKTSVPILIQSSVIMLFPFVLSGFLHLDGYMDVSDAIFSRLGTVEKKRILKDPHIGAFAAIALISLFTLQYSAVYSIVTCMKGLEAFIFIPVISRVTAGLALLNLKLLSDNGLAASFRANTGRVQTVVILSVASLSIFAASCICGIQLLAPLIITILSAICATFYVYRDLGGISGDLCGYIITVSEAAGLLCLAIQP